MKCSTCGGLIILEHGICGVPDRLKCALCGREPKEEKGDSDMEEKTMKLCSNCKKELPATNEYFSKNKSTKDGLEPYCKDCKRDIQQAYRDKKAESGNRHPIKKITQKRSPNLERETNPVPITTASPEAIIKAIRTGFAVEMIQKIGAQFGLKVTVESM